MLKERSIFLARHGSREDAWNAEWIIHAKNPYDPDLSVIGMREARQLAQRLTRERISYLYSSPYLRTVRTAQFCARTLKLPIRVEAGFGEWLNKDWFEQRPRTLPLQRLKTVFDRVDMDYRSITEPEFPESKDGSIQRFGRTIELVLGQTEDGVLIVGHGATFEGVTAALLQGQPFNPSADPASLSRMDTRNGSWSLVYSNDTTFIS